MGQHDWLEAALAADAQAGDVSILLGLRAAVMAYDGVRIVPTAAPAATGRRCAACGQTPCSED